MEKITVAQAAKALGIKPNTLHAALRTGQVPFGIAFKTDESKRNYSYLIYPEKFREYVGEVER